MLLAYIVHCTITLCLIIISCVSNHQSHVLVDQCCPDQADRLPSPIYPDLSVPRGIILIPLAPSLSSNASDVKIIGLTK